MQKSIIEITKSFDPKLGFEKVEKYLRPYGLVQLKNDELFSKLEQLTNMAYPSFEDEWDTRWHYVYMPGKRYGKLICSPFSITLHEKKIYSLSFYGYSRGMGFLNIEKGSEKVNDVYALAFDETIRFIPLLKETDNQLIEQTFPYEWRQGKIQRKYIRPISELMPLEEKEKIAAAYKNHLEKKLTVTEISLNDYLNVCAICLREAFPEKITDDMTPKDIRQRCGDMRHGGMLELENPDSKKEFMEWFNSDSWRGAHPFEIVFSTPHGIMLYPSEQDHPFYRLSIHDPFYYKQYVRMVYILIENNIPFEAHSLEEGLEYITGEAYVGVNVMEEGAFRYESSKEYEEKYLPYIQWDKIEVVKWK
jgi:hypothetical protein